MIHCFGKSWQRLTVGVALLFGVLFLTSVQADDPESGKPKVAANEITQDEIDAAEIDAAVIHSRALSRAFRMAAKKATPSVVTILTFGQTSMVPNQQTQQQSEEDTEDTPGEPSEADENRLTGLGSGVIVSPEGMVITNNHVIRGAKRVVVKLADETEIPATEVRGDPDSDVATLKN